MLFFFSSRRRHTRYIGDWSSDVCSSDLILPRSFRQVEREGLELDGEVDVLEPDVARQADPGRREVEHGLDPGGDELIGHRLGRLGRHRDDRHLHAPSLDLPREIARGEDRDTVDLAADLRGIVVEDDGDPETLPPEAPVVEERRAEVTEADERDRPLTIEPEDA